VRTISALFFAGCAAWALAACATGTTDLPAGGDAQQGSGSGGGGGAGGTSGATTTSSTSGAGGGGDGGGDQGGGGQGGSPSEGCDYTAPQPCSGAQVLPEVRGDEGNDVQSAGGTTSKWLHVYVSESVSDPFDHPDLSYTAELTSPAGMDYDLYVYTGNDQAPNCQAQGVKGVLNPATGKELVSATWGDSLGDEDGTWITVEVRYVSGDVCAAGDAWALSFRGHTNP